MQNKGKMEDDQNSDRDGHFENREHSGSYNYSSDNYDQEDHRSERRSRSKSRSKRSSKSKKSKRDRSPKGGERDSKSRSKSPRKHRSKSKKSKRDRSPKGRDEDRSSSYSHHKRSKKRHSISSSSDDCDDINSLKARIKSLERKQNVDHNYSFNIDDIVGTSEPNLSSTLHDSEKSDHAESDCDFSAILNEGTEGAKKGPALKPDAMHIVSKFFDTELDPAVVKTIKDRYLEPENCSNLSGKAVNVEIYRCLNAGIRKKDFCLKGIQSAVATAAIANLRMIDELTALCRAKQVSRTVADTLITHAADSTKVLAKGYGDISVFRKFVMKPHIQVKYQQLCSKRTFGSSLFGDDLSKEVKTIDEESKIMRNFSRTFPGNNTQRYHPYDARAPKNWQPRGRGSFRPHSSQWRGRGKSYRGRGKAQISQNQTAQQQQS